MRLGDYQHAVRQVISLDFRQDLCRWNAVALPAGEEPLAQYVLWHADMRKQIVEPVFEQIKQARGFRQFLLRGIKKVSAEWAIICTAHNLTRLARAA